MPRIPAARSSASYGAAVSSLKAKFRELDVNRDGMLDCGELATLLRKGLPDMTDREVKGLFHRVDADGSGAVNFDEFVDWCFAPPGNKSQSNGAGPSPAPAPPVAEPELRAAATEVRTARAEAAPFCVELHGASYHPELNGEYMRKGRVLNGHPVYARSDPPSALFYGWTPGGRRAGWFVDDRTPPPGPVLKYIVCCRSPAAESPDRCCAAWETFGGNPDKRMFCLSADLGADELSGAPSPARSRITTPAGGLLEEELSRAALPVGSSCGDFDRELDKQLQEEAGEEDPEDPESQLSPVGGTGPGWEDEDEECEGSPREPEAGPNDFVDLEFPPEESSLGSSMGIHDFDPSLCVANAWSRLPRLHEAPCLFRGGAAPDDVCCSPSAANRWFLSACVAVAEYPAWVRSIFGPTAELRPDGRYAARLYHPGRRGFLRVQVDDLVPTKDGAPAFAGVTPEGELWVALLEKAFAKLCGSYAGTGGGSTAFGLLYLCGGGEAESWSCAEPGRWQRSHTEWRRRKTGAPGATVDRAQESLVQDWAFCDDDKLWELLRDFTRLCYPATCAVREARAAASGLPVDRTYTLVSTREVPAGGGRALRMVFLRDPFGTSRWKGRWGNDSDTWARNPSIRKALQFQPAGDGTFWMSFHDFTRYVQTIDVVRKAMPLQGCHPTKLAEFKTEPCEEEEDDDGSLAAFELPSLAM